MSRGVAIGRTRRPQSRPRLFALLSREAMTVRDESEVQRRPEYPAVRFDVVCDENRDALLEYVS